MTLNYADIVIGILLTLAFAKGFMAGFWASVLSLAGTLVSFIGAYFLTGPVVNYFERANSWVTQATAWWDDVFVLVPSNSKPYDPNAVADFFAGIDSTPWLRPISALIKDRFLEIEATAGPAATWGAILSSLMAQILVSGIVFFVLLTLVRLAWSLFSRTLAFASALSFPQRFFGGVLQLGLSLIWLSLITGALYPLVGLEILGPVRDIVASSHLVGVLLGIYQVLIPAVLLQISPQP
ncbi:MAG TPA: CvpA family protein [Firmicutes bacterium]|nr:CvpA family protein [Candidatus Fermentithermobacillaceae bacterium]